MKVYCEMNEKQIPDVIFFHCTFIVNLRQSLSLIIKLEMIIIINVKMMNDAYNQYKVSTFFSFRVPILESIDN